MVAAANLVEVAALVGDTARATMLNALMGRQSLTATELAYCANVSRSTASGHLSKLVAARLVTVIRNRRFSYYRIASPLVATMLENMKIVAAIEVPPRRQPFPSSSTEARHFAILYDNAAADARGCIITASDRPFIASPPLRRGRHGARVYAVLGRSVGILLAFRVPGIVSRLHPYPDPGAVAKQ